MFILCSCRSVPLQGPIPRSHDSKVAFITSPLQSVRKNKRCEQEAVELGQPRNAMLVPVPKITITNTGCLS